MKAGRIETDWRAVVEQLPSLKNMHDAAQGLRFLNAFVDTEDADSEIVAIEEEIARIVEIVGGFYNLLGDRNWVFSDYLSLSRMEAVTSASSADEAESLLIEYLQEQETLRVMLRRLNKYPDMRPRLPLLEKAADDFVACRYYSSVLVVVSMVDGFVNDVNKSQRKGLHARMPEEMASEDKAATVPVGLPSFQETFNQSVHARIDDEVHEVMRHGLMHGMLTNYDNKSVAAKAWCLLFAVCDWADDKLREEDQCEQDAANPEERFLSALEAVARMKQENAQVQARSDKWTPHLVDLNDPAEDDKSVLADIEGFLESWKTMNYGRLSSYLPDCTHRSRGQKAGEAREIFSEHPIGGYLIERIDRTAPAVAFAEIRIEGTGCSWRSRIRFVKFQDDDVVSDWQEGTWQAMQYAVNPFKDCDA